MTETNYKKLLEDGRDYLYNEADILKLDFAQKLAKLLGMLILGFLISLVVLVMVIFLSLALAHYLMTFLPSGVAYTIVGVLYLVLILFLVRLRAAILIRPLTTAIAGILLGGELKAKNIPAEIERLKQNAELKTEQISSDLGNIREEIEQPFNWFGMVRHIPTVISISCTVIPLLRKFNFRKK